MSWGVGYVVKRWRSGRAELEVALGELNKFSEELSIPDRVTTEAALICSKSLDRGLAYRKPLTRVTASALYAARGEREFPTTLRPGHPDHLSFVAAGRHSVNDLELPQAVTGTLLGES